MTKTLFFLIVAALLMAGCAAAPVVIEKQDVAATAVKTAEETPAAPEKPPRLFEDRELLLDGVKLFNLPDRPEPSQARPVFVSLIQLYPQSRWRPVAEAFIRLIDEREAFREAGRLDRLRAETAQAEKGRALQENEALRKTVRELTERLERFQTETLTLAKDNEQLKQDIQRLKALEIELEKRERTLR
jgi:hypothetical protein